MDDIIKKIPKVGKIYKTVEEAYGALLKGFRSIEKRDPNPIENKMIQAEAKGKIKSQGDNISIFPEDKPEGIMSQAPGKIKTGEVIEASFKPGLDKRGKRVEESPSQATGPDLKSGIIRTDVFDDFSDVTIEGQGDKLRNIMGEESINQYIKEMNDKKLFRAEGIIKKLGAKTDKQKMFVADIVDDIKQGVYQRNDVGASIKSHMYDDLLEQGIDDDTVLNIMYRDTEADDFSTTMAKIKGNAKDEGINIDDTVDFYEKTYYEVGKPRDLKAYGGRMGFADGPDDPKKKSLIKKIPKVGKVVSGVESLKGAIGKIMNRFGEDAITTLDKVDQPEKTTQQVVSEFQARNKPDAIKIESREILDVPPVPSGFKLSKEKLMTKFPELDEDFANDIMDMDKDTQGRIIKMLENRRLDPEAYDRLLAEYGDTLEFQAEFDKVTRRKNNNQGGRAGFSIGGKEGIMQMTSVDDPFYRGGEEDEHSFRMFNKPYKELNEDELEEFREEMMRLMNKFAGLTETDYLKVKDMLDHYHRYKAMPQRKGSKTKTIPKPDFAKEFFRENNAQGGLNYLMGL